MTTTVVVFGKQQRHMCQNKEEDMSSYLEGQTHQLMDRLEAEGFKPHDITLLGQSTQLPDILKVLHGRAKIVPIAPKEEIPLDTIVHIVRSIKPVYPDFVKKVMHSELEKTGPLIYDIASAVSLWLHDKQKNSGVVDGKVIYDYLKQNNMLASCGNLQDALAIQKLGVAAFQKAFGNNVVYFWKSVVQYRDGRLLVPSLCVEGGQVALGWRWLRDDWHDGRPAVRFASSK